jgi:TIR domain
MARIAISYRREDSGVIVGRIFDRLVAHYGAETVFRDIDNIPPGIDFRKYIDGVLDRTDILLAVVGPQWAGKTTDGRSRIAERTDLVRIEVEAALRKDIPLVPILVANANMPQPNELPDVLRDFAYRNAIKVDALEDFDDHLRRLIRSLDRLLQSIRDEAEAKPRAEGQERGKREAAAEAQRAEEQRLQIEAETKRRADEEAVSLKRRRSRPMEKLWSFIRKKRNREILAWAGGGIVVAATVLWVVVVYVFPPSSSKLSAGQTVTAPGGVAVGGDVKNSPITINPPPQPSAK